MSAKTTEASLIWLLCIYLISVYNNTRMANSGHWFTKYNLFYQINGIVIRILGKIVFSSDFVTHGTGTPAEFQILE
jgi:hypothetical protein